MKLSEILIKYATETAQNKVTKQTAEQFLKSLKIEDINLKSKTGVKNKQK